MDFTKALCRLMEDADIEFTFSGKPISNEEVFADTGLLPALARRADQLSSFCLGYGIGVTFVEVEESILGIKVQFDEVTPNVLRVMCLYDVIVTIIDAASAEGKVSLDELMYD